ncbi:DNA recombination protein RmuC [Aestuariibacter sp. AA17]|uniref:DNA recombination protein RmuC n=1 Tax=Fluctibacter corallii TaxID=2984329 RepID=A0ABT3AAG4_9ALTE|nr:DNA recombination protein RmuC [Aestuariibacter sp. AA17]MCV2885277.1 DNA recombination protein RmuC [Aestuariibacter sp. AA17]
MTELSFLDPTFLLFVFFTASCAAAITYSVMKSRLSEAVSRADQAEQKVMLIDGQLESVSLALQELQQEYKHTQERLFGAQQQLGELSQKSETIISLKEEKQTLADKLDEQHERYSHLRAQFDSLHTKAEEEKRHMEEKLTHVEDAEKRLQQQFENLANKIFEQKSQTFSQSNKEGLNALLTPLKEQIDGFKKQISDQYVKEGQERASLKTEIINLKELNKQITEEAAALTRALKGDNKQQGNWGELVLERILKESGLREGHEFEKQVSMKNEGGKLYQPDVVVHLPNDKDIVIDSKVSLAAYERYFNEVDDEAARKKHLAEHIDSLKTHIKQLGKKDYQQLEGIRTLDYVLMFVPVEAAFLLAIDQSPDLVKLALDNNIMLVSPTNLLVALRTINNIWQYEYQNQNAQNIAKKAADLYDKFVGFTTDMDGLGTSLQTVQKRYDAAMNKLVEGRGNLIRKAEAFKELGVQTTKKIDQKLVEKALSDDE